MNLSSESLMDRPPGPDGPSFPALLYNYDIFNGWNDYNDTTADNNGDNHNDYTDYHVDYDFDNNEDNCPPDRTRPSLLPPFKLSIMIIVINDDIGYDDYCDDGIHDCHYHYDDT